MNESTINSNREAFKKAGYILFKEVYDAHELMELRTLFKSAFDNPEIRSAKYNSDSIINDIYRIYPDILDIIINEKYISCLRTILGDDIVWLPECSIHYNRYINWHKDTTEQELNGVQTPKNDDEFLLQCATYFQPNSDLGGGLTVIPGSHTHHDPFLNFYEKGLLTRVQNKLKKITQVTVFDKLDKSENQVQIQSEVGDLLVFDVRLDHRSTGKHAESNKLDKYVIFNTFGNDNDLTRDYLNFMKIRPEPYYKYLQSTQFPSILYAKAQELNIKVWD